MRCRCDMYYTISYIYTTYRILYYVHLSIEEFQAHWFRRGSLSIDVIASGTIVRISYVSCFEGCILLAMSLSVFFFYLLTVILMLCSIYRATKRWGTLGKSYICIFDGEQLFLRITFLRYDGPENQFKFFVTAQCTQVWFRNNY